MKHPWYARVWRWIRSHLWRIDKPEFHPRILKTWRSTMGELLLIDRDVAVAVDGATYRFLPAYERGTSFLLQCDRYRPANCSPDRAGLRHGASAPGHPVPSHRLSLSKIYETKTNQVYTAIEWSYPVDFVGVHGVFVGNDGYARSITARVAQNFLQQYYERICFEQIICDAASKFAGSNHDRILENLQRDFA